MKKILFNVINQIIPIMIGVYLGFALNNYGENRKLKKQASTFKKMLVNEIEHNFRAIKKVKPYHDTLYMRVNNVLRSENMMQAFKEFRFTGLRPGIVNSSAYQTGVQTGILQEFDLELIQFLNRLYKFQGHYEEYNRTMMGAFLAKDFPESEKEVKSLFTTVSMNMSDVTNSEQELKRIYDEALENLK